VRRSEKESLINSITTVNSQNKVIKVNQSIQEKLDDLSSENADLKEDFDDESSNEESVLHLNVIPTASLCTSRIIGNKSNRLNPLGRSLN
jgi:hypothetical protein